MSNLQTCQYTKRKWVELVVVQIKGVKLTFYKVWGMESGIQQSNGCGSVNVQKCRDQICQHRKVLWPKSKIR